MYFFIYLFTQSLTLNIIRGKRFFNNKFNVATSYNLFSKKIFFYTII